MAVLLRRLVNTTGEDIVEVMSQRAFCHLVKPLQMDELLRQVRRALVKAQIRAPILRQLNQRQMQVLLLLAEKLSQKKSLYLPAPESGKPGICG